MSDEAKIIQVFDNYETAGLIEKDPEKVLSFLTDNVMGFGMGEQGFVKSKQEVSDIIRETVRAEDPAVYQLEYHDVFVQFTSDTSANLCGKVCVKRYDQDKVTLSSFSQSLSFVCCEGEWLICALHASPVMLTDESIESYPMAFADKTLMHLRDEHRRGSRPSSYVFIKS